MIPANNCIEEFILSPILQKKYVYRFTNITSRFSKNKKDTNMACIRDIEITYLGKIKDLFVFNVFTAKVSFKSDQLIPISNNC